MTRSAQTFFQWSDLVRITPADDGVDGADAYWTDALAQALEFALRGWRILPLYGIRQCAQHLLWRSGLIPHMRPVEVDVAGTEPPERERDRPRC